MVLDLMRSIPQSYLVYFKDCIHKMNSPERSTSALFLAPVEHGKLHQQYVQFGGIAAQSVDRRLDARNEP
jgi:hypothetical protein